jgi:hypothetical protein
VFAALNPGAFPHENGVWLSCMRGSAGTRSTPSECQRGGRAEQREPRPQPHDQAWAIIRRADRAQRLTADRGTAPTASTALVDHACGGAGNCC